MWNTSSGPGFYLESRITEVDQSGLAACGWCGGNFTMASRLQEWDIGARWQILQVAGAYILHFSYLASWEW